MEPALQDPPVEKDAKPAFRKPVNDASSRRYRRHSPGAGSDASSDDDEKPGRTRDHVPFKQDETQKVYKKRNDDEADKDRDYYSKSRRGGESYKQSDRYSSGSSHAYRRHDDYGNRGYRDADRDDRNYRRPQSSRDVRENNSSSHSRREHTHERYRENLRSSGDRYSRDKSDSGYRIKEKDRDARQHLNDNDSGSQRRHANSLNETARTLDLERYKERGVRDDRREHHGGVDSKTNPDNASSHRRESTKEGQDNSLNKRKHDEVEYKKHRDMHSEEVEDPKNGRGFLNEHEREKRNVGEEDPLLSKLKLNAEDENPRSNKEKTSKFSTEPGQADVVPDLGAAKFAAMKAAEIVNRNLIGGGLSTTEQKKKLLWGNKKTTTTEESTSQWDLSLFPDRERQEKFKKLMGVKGDLKLEPKPDDKDGNIRAEKRKELEMDLEKQYTAGLRRRDGRTVGLGL